MKKVIYIIIFFGITSSVIAQQSFSSWQYNMSFGSGDLHDYIGKTSFRGSTYNYTKLVREGIGAGLEIGWIAFYEKKPYDTYSRGDFDISGKQYRYSNNVPLLFTASYFLNPDNDLSPYAGLGIGTMWSERRTTMGSYDIYQDAWPFTLRPEIGIMFDTGGLGLSLSGKYYYGFKTGDLTAQSFYTINIGLVFVR